MKKTIATAFCVLTLFSCVSVEFKYPQPKKSSAMSSFPAEMQGQYLVFNKDTSLSNKPIVIAENYFTELHLDGPDKKEKKAYISDSLVLKSIDKDYILNFRDKEYWTAIVLREKQNFGYSVLWINGDDSTCIEKIHHITKSEIIRDEDGKIEKYILNPKKSSLRKLLKEDGIFTELYQLKKLQE